MEGRTNWNQPVREAEARAFSQGKIRYYNEQAAAYAESDPIYADFMEQCARAYRDAEERRQARESGFSGNR